jgi:hypothetical protein
LLVYRLILAKNKGRVKTDNVDVWPERCRWGNRSDKEVAGGDGRQDVGFLVKGVMNLPAATAKVNHRNFDWNLSGK